MKNKKEIAIIVAMDKNGLIGSDNNLPWHFSEDLRYFKEKTEGKFVIMGERTYNSIGKPLPGRKIIVLSHNSDLKIAGVKVANSIEDALFYADGEVMIAGGASVYKQFLDKADRIYLTLINKIFKGNIFFPKFNKDDWKIVSEKKGENKFLAFQILERKI